MNNAEYWLLYRAAFKLEDPTEEEYLRIEKLYQAEGRDEIYSRAKRKKIIHAVACLLSKLNIDKEYWQPIANSYRERNEAVVSCLDSVYHSLNTAGVEKMGVVENFGALLCGESDLAMFGSGDADNYADISEKEKIYEVMKQQGYEIVESKAGNILVSTAFKNCPDLPDCFYFSINWDLTNRVNLPGFTCKKPFIQWDQSTFYRDTSIRIPPIEALMYICLLHIAVHGFCKAPDIRLYYDIASVAKREIDWSKIEEWAIRDQHQTRIAVATMLSNRLLNVSIPDQIMNLGKPQQRDKLLQIVSDAKENRLKDFPNKLTSLQIDIDSCDGGIASGLKYVFFPDSDWIKRKYGSVLVGHIRHLIDLC